MNTLDHRGCSVKDHIVNATKEWFWRRNDNWIARDYELLYTVHGIQPVVEEMDRRFELFSKRNAVDKKTITDVDIYEVRTLDQSTHDYEVLARESIRFIYELRGTLEYEQRVIDHVLTWHVSPGKVELIAHRHRAEAVTAFESSDDGHDTLNFRAYRDHRPRAPYQRTLATRYAELWWDRVNPDYLGFHEDCTNFVSQVLYSGNIPMHVTEKRETGWWFRAEPKPNWSYSWSVAHALVNYLRKTSQYVHASEVHDPKQLQLGDMISYDWRGSGTYHHMTVVTGFDGNGDPLVNAHTVNSRMRHYSYEDSHAWTEQTRYLFLHVDD